MGLNILKSFKDFANELVAKVKQAIDLLDEPPVPKQVPLSDNRGGYQKPVSTTSPVAEVRNVPDSPQKSLLKVVLYWLNSSYFQPIDVEICKDSQKSHSISLIYADHNKYAIESLSKSLQKDRKFWVHVGHIMLSDVLTKPFEELNWDKSELKGHTVLFEMKVNFVEVDNTALNLDDELIFEYQKGTLRVSPYLFLFSLFKNGGIKEIKKNFNVISLHKEFCERWETTIREYKISTNSTKTYFTLRSLKQWMDCCLKELGWNDLIKLPNEPGSNEEYIATFSKVDEKSDSVIPQDFYFDDLYHIFQEALKEPKYCGVLMPMVHALFQPAITPQSWYSNKHIKQYIDKRYYTAARWPSPYSPVLMQQMAINLATDGHEPVFSVNGPPGTGKTTLLKDIIAQKVFERAKLIAEQKGECFESPIYFRAVALRYCKPHTIHPLKRQFKDCNMLVASCNNAAVENLTRELPDWANMPKQSDLVGDSQEPFDYFRRQATALLQELKQDQSEAWGLIAVPLGKQDNIACFIKACLEDLDAELLQIAGSDPSKALQVAINRFNTQLQAVEKMRNLLGTDQWQSLDPDSEEAQKGNPFHHDAFNREREKLFYASLAVLKQFNALPQMRDNLDALKEFCCAKTNIVKHTYFSGHSIKDGKQLLNIKDLAPTLYDTMFSLVPVVSTTFASVKTMFGDVKAPGRLGCLIVDEAGQASPHMAAGALWRASKTIVVGDPKQVEPVVKTDAIVKRYCRKLLQLEDVEFLYEDYSLQTMADLTNHYGGYIGEHIPSNWVGCPLRVHRRCCEPMFTISNTTSYGGTMILGGKATVSADKVDQMLLPYSCWLSMAATKHFA